MLVVNEMNVVAMLRQDIDGDFGCAQVVDKGSIGPSEIEVEFGVAQRAIGGVEELGDGALRAVASQGLSLEVFKMGKSAFSAISWAGGWRNSPMAIRERGGSLRC